MALLITDKCINCDMCVAECPNQAITEGLNIYEIDANRCTECVGFYTHQTCVDVCPIECIIPHPVYVETAEQLMNKFKSLNLAA